MTMTSRRNYDDLEDSPPNVALKAEQPVPAPMPRIRQGMQGGH